MSHEFCDCLVEMNRHIEELLKLKAEPILIQAAVHDRHIMIEPKAPMVEPPLWSIPTCSSRSRQTLFCQINSNDDSP